ncbi:hypothetical protein E1171_15515 [Cytophagales bacterium RKSG123]|nr:hypothetical protein [Xanthovirga aplysinae]
MQSFSRNTLGRFSAFLMVLFCFAFNSHSGWAQSGSDPEGDFSYELIGGESPQMIFKPGYAGVGDNIVLMYYQKGGASGNFPGYQMQRNSDGNFTYPLDITAGETISFYFTYSVPEGGERNSLDNIQTVTYQGAQEPVLSRIQVQGPASAIKVGETFQFTATGYNDFDQETAISPNWTVSGGGSISNSGLFTASEAGTFTVRASSDGVSGTRAFTVEAVQQPTDPTTGVCEGAGPNGDYSYEVSGDDNPTITFKAGRPGVGNQIVLLYYTVNGGSQPYPGYQMTANGDGTFSAQLNAVRGQSVHFYFTYSLPEGGERNSMNNEHVITIGECDGPTDPGTGTPVLSNIVISTPSSPLAINQNYTFTARGIDQNGNEMNVNFEWSVSGGGQINAQTGAFTASTSGSFTVTAKSGDVSRTASFRVGEPTSGGGDLPDCELFKQLINKPDAARNRSIFD